MNASINTARGFVIVGFLIGLISLWQTVGHVGHPAFLLIDGSSLVDVQAAAAAGVEVDDYLETLPAEDLAVQLTLSNGVEAAGYVADENPEHVWYHMWREANGDVAAMIVVLLLLFLPSQARSKAVWWSMTIILIGYYSPFWTGALIDRGMGAPHIMAEIVHIIMAALPVTGILLARRHYVSNS